MQNCGLNEISIVSERRRLMVSLPSTTSQPTAQPLPNWPSTNAVTNARIQLSFVVLAAGAASGKSLGNVESTRVFVTIEFARGLELDLLKFGITIGFPGTRMFNEYAHAGLVRTYDWDEYYIYTEKPLFTHRYLDDATVLKTMQIAYRRAILTNPGFIRRRVQRGLKTGEFFWDAYYALAFFLLPASNKNGAGNTYYARDRWPSYDFTARPPTLLEYPKVAYKKS